MKKIFLLILLPVSLFFSCVGDRIASETMDRAEILLEANPDSAYILLNEVKTPDRLNERQFARWCMLYCRAADKLFKDMLYTEQLDRALVGYKSHGAAEQQAWMGLYLGRSYVKDKLFIPAMKAYSDALSLAKEKYLYDVAGYICSYMADLYTYTGQRSEERRKFEEAAEFFKQAGNERSYAFALRDVAKTWAFDDSLSLALHYMLIADSVITRFQDLRGISSISNGLGNIYDLMGDVEKARAYYSRSLSSDTMDQVPSYLALSDLYYNESLLDSARYYLALATGPSLNPYTSIDCFYLGYLIEKEAGDTEKALSLLEQYQAKKDYSAIADRVCKEEKKNIESVYKNIYDSYNDKYKTVSDLKISKFTASIADTSFRVDSDDGCPMIKVSIKLGYTYKIQYSGSDKANDKNNNNNSAYIYYKYEDGKWNINSMYLGFGFY